MADLKELYPSSFTQDEMINAATVSVLKDVPTKLGEYKVQAGEVIGMGYGDSAELHNAVGRIFASLKTDASADVKGKLRFSIYSPQNRPMQILGEYDLDIINDNETDRTKQRPLPFNKIFITEDKKLVCELISKTDVTVSKANSKMLFDVTQGVV
jgi:hypothetical protein